MIDYNDLEAGRELDAMVWQALNGQEVSTITCRYVDGDVQPHAGYPVGHVSPLHYSEDMNAALLGLNKFTDVELEKTGGDWSCLIYDSNYMIVRKSLPLAISIAILTTVDDTL